MSKSPIHPVRAGQRGQREQKGQRGREASQASQASSVLARGGQSLAALPAKAAQELSDLERDLGGRQALITALTYAPPHKDIRYILGLLGDPENDRTPLADLCYAGRVMPGQLVDALAKGTELRARLLATQLITRRLPTVVEDVMLKAAPYEDTCPQCQGLGSVMPDPTPENSNPAQESCPACLGHGRLRYDADGKCRDLALEMGGLVGKGGGIQIVNTQQVAQVAAGGAGSFGGMEGFQELLDAVLYGQDGGRQASQAPEPVGDEPTVEGEVLTTEGAAATDNAVEESPRHVDTSQRTSPGDASADTSRL